MGTTANITIPLGPSQDAVLAALAEGPATGAELARRCGLPVSSVSGAARKLARRGLVTGPPPGRPGRGNPGLWERIPGGTPPRARYPDRPRDYVPSRREIADACAAIREEWSPLVELSRRGVAYTQLADGRGGYDLAVPAANPIGAGMPSCVVRRNGRLMARQRRTA